MFAIQAQDLKRAFVRRERSAGLLAALKSFASPTFVTKVAIDSVNFEVPHSSIVGVVGANGAGKTTLLKMIAGLLHPSSGKISVLGFEPYKRNKNFLKQIGMVMGQKSQLWTDIPAQDTFELVGSFYEIPSKECKDRVFELSELFGVKHLLGVQVRRLSLGERMKFEVIASLLHSPKLLILDEPTIGLDVLAQHNIREFLRNYNKNFKTTILLSSHHMEDITEVCDRLLVVSHGQLKYSGELSQFQAKKNEFANVIRELISEEKTTP